MVASVEDAWSRIGSWLARHAPGLLGVLAPPATDADIRAVEEAHEVAVPQDLREWWKGANGLAAGFKSSFATIVPPGHYPSSTAGAVNGQRSGRQAGLDVAKKLGYDYADLIAEISASPAGTESSMGQWVWLPSWIEITIGGDPLFVDCRDGDWHGCVMQQFSTGGWRGPLWPSVAAMWSEAASIIESLDPDVWPLRVDTSVGSWIFPGRGPRGVT
jgi:cell wall assembly regulator SMI1